MRHAECGCWSVPNPVIVGAVGVLVPVAVGLANFGFLVMCRRAAVRENALSKRVQRSSDYVEQAPMADGGRRLTPPTSRVS
jgi:hypothetical protein